ncbi:MAG: hypothetical protein FE78DRAFT_26486 [Acidomyces sp. 'richmondensis']|nr:MAG: hypothetical protein FE78DRAFT_26486 [Acidomyces sp. 'richmondensis']
MDVQKREKENHKKPDMDNKAKAKDTRALEDIRRKTGGSKNNGKEGGNKKEREKSKPKLDRKYQQRGPQQEEED